MEERQGFFTALCFSLALIANRVHCPPSKGKEESSLRTSAVSWVYVCRDKLIFSLQGRMLNSARPALSLLFHCCSFSLPNPCVAWEERCLQPPEGYCWDPWGQRSCSYGRGSPWPEGWWSVTCCLQLLWMQPWAETWAASTDPSKSSAWPKWQAHTQVCRV